jgi:hypothetical protein
MANVIHSRKEPYCEQCNNKIFPGQPRNLQYFNIEPQGSVVGAAEGGQHVELWCDPCTELLLNTINPLAIIHQDIAKRIEEQRIIALN